MVLFGPTLDVGVALLLVTALAEYGRFREKRQQAFRLLASAGFLLVGAGVFESVPRITFFASTHNLVQSVFQASGEIIAILAVIVLAINAVLEKGRRRKRRR